METVCKYLQLVKMLNMELLVEKREESELRLLLIRNLLKHFLNVLPNLTTVNLSV